MFTRQANHTTTRICCPDSTLYKYFCPNSTFARSCCADSTFYKYFCPNFTFARSCCVDSTFYKYFCPNSTFARSCCPSCGSSSCCLQPPLGSPPALDKRPAYNQTGGSPNFCCQTMLPRGALGS